MYRKLIPFLRRFFKESTLLKFLFNINPVYRRTGAKIMYVSDDLKEFRARLAFGHKTQNYVGTMFGGSMFSAADPVYMIQFMELLGRGYVVWDKSAKIHFKKPVKEDLYLSFIIMDEEIKKIKNEVIQNGKYVFTKEVELIGKSGNPIFAVVEKELYVASKEYFKNRKRR